MPILSYTTPNGTEIPYREPVSLADTLAGIRAALAATRDAELDEDSEPPC